MKLKEAIHHSIDTLDTDALAELYEQIQVLQQSKHEPAQPSSAPRIEEVLNLTSASPDSWSAGVIAHRDERV